MSLAYSILHNNTPEYWNRGGDECGVFVVPQYSTEFQKVNKLIKESYGTNNYRIHSVKRVQNSNFYCQFLCKRESLARTNNSYYDVPFFITVSKDDLNAALKYNLDPRRLNNLQQLILQPKICYVYGGSLLIVRTLVQYPHSAVQPNSSNEYYIEYIVSFE